MTDDDLNDFEEVSPKKNSVLSVVDEILVCASQAQSWVYFIAISYIIAAAVLMVSLSLMRSYSRGPFDTNFNLGWTLFFLLLSTISLLPGIFMISYRNAIGRAVVSRSTSDIKKHFWYQNFFWKVKGLSFIIFWIIFIFKMFSLFLG